MKTVIMVHGWDGSPDACWFPWMKKELEERDFKIIVPAMPDPEHPDIDKWVNALADLPKPDEDFIFVGHSIGCQAIMRFLQNSVIMMAKPFRLTVMINRIILDFIKKK